MKLRLPQRRVWRAAIYLGSLVLVLLAIDLVLVQTRRTIYPGYQTTRILGPKMDDGRIDYLIAIDEEFARGVTPENNAAIFMFRAFGREGLSPKQPPNGVTDALGMEALPEKGQYFVAFDPYVKAMGGTDSEPDLPTDIDSDTKWPLVIGPHHRAWIESIKEPLNLMVEGSHRSRFFIPFYAGYHPDTIAETYLKHALLLRQSCNALLLRALIRLDAGDVAGFREDALAVHRWTRLISQSQTLIERVVAFGLETTACQVDRLAMSSGKVSPADIRAFGTDLAQLGDLRSPLDTVDGERYMTLDLLQWMAKGGPKRVAFALNNGIFSSVEVFQAGLGARIGTMFLPVDYDACMARMNSYYDSALAGARKPTWQARRDAIQLWEADVNSLMKGNRIGLFLSPDWPAALLLPALMGNVMKDESARAELRLTRVAIALALFKAEHGSYPKSLSELVPNFLPETIKDPFTEDSFKYSAAESVYVLYSVGPNMIDEQARKDDIKASTQSTVTTMPSSAK